MVEEGVVEGVVEEGEDVVEEGVGEGVVEEGESVVEEGEEENLMSNVPETMLMIGGVLLI